MCDWSSEALLELVKEAGRGRRKLNKGPFPSLMFALFLAVYKRQVFGVWRAQARFNLFKKGRKEERKQGTPLAGSSIPTKPESGQRPLPQSVIAGHSSRIYEICHYFSSLVMKAIIAQRLGSTPARPVPQNTLMHACNIDPK